MFTGSLYIWALEKSCVTGSQLMFALEKGCCEEWFTEFMMHGVLVIKKLVGDTKENLAHGF